jgi:hypothetical protein
VTGSQRTVESVLPNARDRRIPALRSVLGHAPLFYRSELSEQRPRPMRVPVVHLYLDVSGSMTACLPHLSAACCEPFKRGELIDACIVDQDIGTQGPRSDKARCGIHGDRHQRRARAHHCYSHETSAQVILIATDGYVGPGRSDLIRQARSHPGGGALTHPGTQAISNYGARNDPTSKTMNQHAEYTFPGTSRPAGRCHCRIDRYHRHRATEA